MKLNRSILTKDSTGLFYNKYKYKIVLVITTASLFRGNKLASTCTKLKAILPADYKAFRINNKAEHVYSIKLCTFLASINDEIAVRVESPFLSIYTNNELAVKQITDIDPSAVKMVCLPNKDGPVLEKDTIVVKSIDFGFKVHMASTRRQYTDFLSWSEGNPKIRLTNSAKMQLKRPKTWGGFYFYVKDDKSLIMVKMFLGSDIRKVETIIKA